MAAERGRNELATTESGQQVVVFRVESSLYGLPLSAVVEVVRMVQLTPIPGTPAWVAGYLNLRGKILPVADTRLWLEATEQPAIHLNTPILIVQADNRQAGWIVDEVSDVSMLVQIVKPNNKLEDEIATLDGRPLLLIDPEPALVELYQITRHSHRLFARQKNGNTL